MYMYLCSILFKYVTYMQYVLFKEYKASCNQNDLVTM